MQKNHQCIRKGQFSLKICFPSILLNMHRYKKHNKLTQHNINPTNRSPKQYLCNAKDRIS